MAGSLQVAFLALVLTLILAPSISFLGKMANGFDKKVHSGFVSRLVISVD